MKDDMEPRANLEQMETAASRKEERTMDDMKEGESVKEYHLRKAREMKYPHPMAPNINQRRYNSKYGGGFFGRN